MAKTTTTPRGIGDNRPPKEDATAAITDRLNEDYSSAEKRTKELLANARKLPTTVTDDDMLEKFSLLVREIREHTNTVEACRKAEKDPFLRGGEAVDGFFGGIKDRLTKTAKILHLRVDDYQQEKLERQRAEQEAARRKAAEEARAAEDAARRARDEQRKAQLTLDAKIAAQKAATAEHVAAEGLANPASAARTRFETGPLVTMAKNPTATVVDYDALPLDVLRPYIKRDALDAAVRMWARATDYRDTMPGVTVEHSSKTVIR